MVWDFVAGVVLSNQVYHVSMALLNPMTGATKIFSFFHYNIRSQPFCIKYFAGFKDARCQALPKKTIIWKNRYIFQKLIKKNFHSNLIKTASITDPAKDVKMQISSLVLK